MKALAIHGQARASGLPYTFREILNGWQLMDVSSSKHSIGLATSGACTIPGRHAILNEYVSRNVVEGQQGARVYLLGT